MGNLVHLAEQLTKKKYDPVEAAAYDKAPDPVPHTFQQKEAKPLPSSQRNNDEKAKVKFRLLQMGAKEVA